MRGAAAVLLGVAAVIGPGCGAEAGPADRTTAVADRAATATAATPAPTATSEALDNADIPKRLDADCEAQIAELVAATPRRFSVAFEADASESEIQAVGTRLEANPVVRSVQRSDNQQRWEQAEELFEDEFPEDLPQPAPMLDVALAQDATDASMVALRTEVENMPAVARIDGAFTRAFQRKYARALVHTAMAEEQASCAEAIATIEQLRNS